MRHRSPYRFIRCAALWLGLGTPLAASAAKPTVLYVSARATKPHRGTLQQPYRRIATAIARARAGATLRIAAGRYRENLIVRGKALSLEGGYRHDFVRRDPARYRSELVGDGKDAVVNLIASGTSVLDGLTISGGGGSRQTGPHYIRGGGISIQGGAVTIRHCTVEKNQVRVRGKAERSGGGIAVASATRFTLEHNVIRHNEAPLGGGVQIVETKDVRLVGNYIAHNRATSDHGGGLYVRADRALIEENLLLKNEVGRSLGYGWGGGLALIGTRATVRRNVVTQNFAASQGSGEFIDDGSVALIEDELVVGNACAKEGGSGIYVDGSDPKRGSEAQIRHSTIINHPCPGHLGGHGVRATQASQVRVERSVLWNNRDDISADASSNIAVSDSIIQERLDNQDNSNQPPRFRDGKGGDFRLVDNPKGRGIRYNARERHLERWRKFFAAQRQAAAAAQTPPVAGAIQPGASAAGGSCSWAPTAEQDLASLLPTLLLALLVGARPKGHGRLSSTWNKAS